MTVALAISPTSGLVFHSAILRGMNGPSFDDFLAQTRLNLDPNEHMIFIYDGVPVGQAVSALKAAIDRYKSSSNSSIDE